MRISDWSSDVCSSDLPTGAVRVLLSRVSVTSAKSRAGRAVVPAKITSSIPPPRSDRALDSPIVQRIASSRLDLPQPLGPTTPDNPRSILSSVESTKLLKPESLSSWKFKAAPTHARQRDSAARRQAWAAVPSHTQHSTTSHHPKRTDRN